MTMLNGPSGGEQAGTPAHKCDLARRFRAAWADGPDHGTAIPELLPVRLAKACVQVLPVAGAGLSLLNHDFRVPVGASDEVASCAERLQFTQGEGPCLDAARKSRITIADADEIEQQWPSFAAEFLQHTPYQGAICIPLNLAPEMLGALDLFVTVRTIYTILGSLTRSRSPIRSSTPSLSPRRSPDPLAPGPENRSRCGCRAVLFAAAPTSGWRSAC